MPTDIPNQRTELANSRFIHSAVRAIPSGMETKGVQFNSLRAKLLQSTLTGTSKERPAK
jgi:hypothetical protein